MTEWKGPFEDIKKACERWGIDTEAEPVGRWEQDWIAELVGVWVCSECKQPARLNDEAGNSVRVKYCPNCGARMTGGGDDD